MFDGGLRAVEFVKPVELAIVHEGVPSGELRGDGRESLGD